MKKIIFASLISIISISCSKDEVTPAPTASFITKLNDDGNVTFIMSSDNADSYIWDFGDGKSSTEKVISYTYPHNGTFSVKLTARGKGGEIIQTGKVLVNNITGSIVFWIQTARNKEIEFFVDGKSYGKITGAHTDGVAPDCGDKYSVTASYLLEGQHTFEAQEVNSFTPTKWKNEFIVSGRECRSVKIQY